MPVVLFESFPLLTHMLKLPLDRTEPQKDSILGVEKPSLLLQNVIVQGATYVAKSTRTPHAVFFSS